MKAIKYILASAMCLLVSTACSGNRKIGVDTSERASNEAKTESEKKDGKMLVVFFSHAGDNYAVGNIKVGNTKLVADYISELTGADQFEIKTSKYDGMKYSPLCELAKEEQQKGELPPYDDEPADLSQYDTVFVGGPVWWGTWPQIMFTFFRNHAADLEGKTLIPFTTHEGSGLGRCVDDLEQSFPKSTVTGEFSMYGHDVRSGKEDVEKWLKEIGF